MQIQFKCKNFDSNLWLTLSCMLAVVMLTFQVEGYTRNYPWNNNEEVQQKCYCAQVALMLLQVLWLLHGWQQLVNEFNSMVIVKSFTLVTCSDQPSQQTIWHPLI